MPLRLEPHGVHRGDRATRQPGLRRLWAPPSCTTAATRMASHLRNRHLEFELDERGVWCLRSSEEDGGLALVGSLGGEWRAGSDRKSWTGAFPNAAAAHPAEIDTPAGQAPGLTVDLVAPGSHVAVHLEFALPEEVPCLLWRARLRVGEGPSIRLGCVDLLNA